ncbi:MAG: MTH938/NDUFAF3 family protein, partial [Anaerolineales bacterium]
VSFHTPPVGQNAIRQHDHVPIIGMTIDDYLAETYALEDLQQALADRLELLVIGTGLFGRMSVPGNVRAKVEAGGLEMRVLATREACDLYNHMREQKRSAAALHITC